MARRKYKSRKKANPGTGALTVQFKVIFDEITEGAQLALYEAADRVGEEACQKLRSTSPRRATGRTAGRYANGWTYKQTPEGGVVYNATDWQLTHLLEKGHVVRNAKGTFGRAPAHPHIKPVEEWANEEAAREVERILS